MTKRVLLIGGAGFIGKHLEKRLTSNGHVVNIIDKKVNENINNGFYENNKHYDIVYFLAAEANLKAVKLNPLDAIKTMTVGLTNCLEAFPDTHFVYVSSSMVYGDWDSYDMSETDKCGPVDLYGQLKLAGEGIVKELHKEAYTIVRPTAVYGPDDDQSRVIPLFIELAKNNETLTVNGHSTMLDFTYIDDLIDGLILVMENKNSHNITFNLSYGDSVALESVAKYIIATIGKGKLVVSTKDLEYPDRGTLNVSRAKELLGYNPKLSYIEGINKLLEE